MAHIGSARAATAARALALVISTALLGCGASPSNDQQGTSQDALRMCSDGPTVSGIDVSEYQPDVDWAAVRRSGRAFAFLRVSDGLNYPDDSFSGHWRAAGSAGLLRGAYQYFRPGQDAHAQADLLLRRMGPLGVGDLPPVIDVETADGQSDATILRGVRAWIADVRRATGRQPIVYAASGFWDTLSGASDLASQNLWVANYGVSCPSIPTTWRSTGWTFWQTSDTGRVPGIAGRVDTNLFNGTLAELTALALPPDRALPMDVSWSAEESGAYTFRATGPASVRKVEYHVDGYDVGTALQSANGAFETRYSFTNDRVERSLEARGLDDAGRVVARGVALLDVTRETGAFVRQTGDRVYEIGLERAEAAVASVEVRADGHLLYDSVSNTRRSPRNAVREIFHILGERNFQITTFDSAGRLRGRIERSFTLR